MKKTILGIVWSSCQNFKIIIPLLISGMCIIWYGYRKKEKLINLLVKPVWRSLLIKHYSSLKSKVRLVLWFISLSMICAALLQPQWGKKEEKIEQEGRELFVALDVSRSMLAQDIKPTRLAFAQSKIKRLLQLLPAERVGLIIFSGMPVVQCPLTRDTGLFNMFLNQLDAETISTGTTALDQVILKTISIIEKMPTRKNKILVIFTDGEDFSNQLSYVKQRAQEAGLHIFTYGVGTQEGAPVPIIKEGKTVGFEKNEQSNVVLTKLNEGILRALSQETGAHYIAPTQTESDLQTLVQCVTEYEKESFDDKQLSTQEDRYYYFLAVSFLALLLEWII